MANVKPAKEYSINQKHHKLQAQNSKRVSHSGFSVRNIGDKKRIRKRQAIHAIHTVKITYMNDYLYQEDREIENAIFTMKKFLQNLDWIISNNISKDLPLNEISLFWCIKTYNHTYATCSVESNL